MPQTLQRRIRVAVFGAALAVAGSVSIAEAALQVRFSVPKNSREVVVIDYEFGPNCQTLPHPVAKVVTPPKHGTLSIRQGSGTIQENNRCKGSKSNSIAIIYRPAKDFTGRDTFEIDWSFTIIEPRREGYAIVVQD
jgi:hypothetical protein